MVKGNNNNKFGGNSSNQRVENMKFDYPYNFVRIEEKVEREAIDKGDFSGKIICTLTNKSPIFFPESKGNENYTNHSREMFYKKDGKYIIPASSLKGSFRSVLEAISNSCLINIKDSEFDRRLPMKKYNNKNIGIIKTLPTKVTPGVIVLADIARIDKKLVNNYSEGFYTLKVSNKIKNYKIQLNNIKNPEDYAIKNLNELDSNLKKLIKANPNSIIKTIEDFEAVTSRQQMEAILWISPDINTKKTQKILFPSSLQNRTIKYSYEEFENLLFFINKMNKDSNNYYIHELKIGDAIIFQTNNKNEAINLAFSEIPRIKYKNALKDMIHKELTPCETFEKACYACRIFGMTGNNNEDKKEEDKDKISLQGRVFFKDATIDKEKANIQPRPILIKSLGEPHPTLTGFYLENGTYDDKTKIRGRKFYWHHKDKLNRDYSSFKSSITPAKEEKHNSSIQFMNYGNEFNFEVSFKNLKEDELGLLLLTLELENGMLHKFGKGKALGFGSSEVKITKLLLQSKNKYESFESSYIESEDKKKFIDIFKNKFNLENRKQWADLKIIMGQSNKLDFSKSPFPELEKNRHINTLNWFTEMKKIYEGNFKLPKIQDYK
ncbi:CRISPR-associated protein [Cetobacterium ceti]|uniref:CRISPR-associated protein n=1 Tax=Cetobacterium ceti TaxID=180163 RepID=A0A1T4NQI1_9FUSO|nr:TIGR03986 family CRISPR-associated RAMP protein [Cetobacterium ceti]SJZ81474.1 CRISPR-associated protein [Cetobacterium ceti]